MSISENEAAPVESSKQNNILIHVQDHDGENAEFVSESKFDLQLEKCRWNE